MKINGVGPLLNIKMVKFISLYPGTGIMFSSVTMERYLTFPVENGATDLEGTSTT